MGYAVRVAPGAVRTLKKLPADTCERILSALLVLESNPRPPGAGKLSAKDNVYRVRVGDYRILYEIKDDELLVVVVKVAHRREAYYGKPRLTWERPIQVEGWFEQVVVS